MSAKERVKTVGERLGDGRWRCRACGYRWMPRQLNPDDPPKKCGHCFKWLDSPWKGEAP